MHYVSRGVGERPMKTRLPTLLLVACSAFIANTALAGPDCTEQHEAEAVAKAPAATAPVKTWQQRLEAAPKTTGAGHCKRPYALAQCAV
jgi:hypothetical protein